MVTAATGSARSLAIRPSSARIHSVDALRGAVMILMALDHVRDYISRAAMQFSPTNLTQTTAALFLPAGLLIFALRYLRSPRGFLRFSGCAGIALQGSSRASW
jgi:uncharacterized membrane protein